jgi:hypothetical protein
MAAGGRRPPRPCWVGRRPSRPPKLVAGCKHRHMPLVCQNPDHQRPLVSAQKHARLTFPMTIPSNQGSKGRSPWLGVQGAGWPRAARRVGERNREQIGVRRGAAEVRGATAPCRPPRRRTELIGSELGVPEAQRRAGVGRPRGVAGVPGAPPVWRLRLGRRPDCVVCSCCHEYARGECSCNLPDGIRVSMEYVQI